MFVYVPMYTCIHIYVCMNQKHAVLRICIFSMYTHIGASIYECVCSVEIHICIYIYIYIYTDYVTIYIHIYIYIYIFFLVLFSINVYIYIYVCVCICLLYPGQYTHTHKYVFLYLVLSIVVCTYLYYYGFLMFPCRQYIFDICSGLDIAKSTTHFMVFDLLGFGDFHEWRLRVLTNHYRSDYELFDIPTLDAKSLNAVSLVGIDDELP